MSRHPSHPAIERAEPEHTGGAKNSADHQTDHSRAWLTFLAGMDPLVAQRSSVVGYCSVLSCSFFLFFSGQCLVVHSLEEKRTRCARFRFLLLRITSHPITVRETPPTSAGRVPWCGKTRTLSERIRIRFVYLGSVCVCVSEPSHSPFHHRSPQCRVCPSSGTGSFPGHPGTESTHPPYCGSKPYTSDPSLKRTDD